MHPLAKPIAWGHWGKSSTSTEPSDLFTIRIPTKRSSTKSGREPSFVRKYDKDRKPRKTKQANRPSEECRRSRTGTGKDIPNPLSIDDNTVTTPNNSPVGCDVAHQRPRHPNCTKLISVNYGVDLPSRKPRRSSSKSSTPVL